jgi:hypothetical protein
MSAQVQRVLIQAQQVQMDGAEFDREAIDDMRADQIRQKQLALDGKQNASNIRGDAQDTQTATQAGSAALGAIGAIATAACLCAGIPIVGAIIAAILAVIIAIILIIAYIQTKNAEQKAAAQDKQAGNLEIRADQLNADIDAKNESRREERQKVQADFQQYLQTEAENREMNREALS